MVRAPPLTGFTWPQLLNGQPVESDITEKPCEMFAKNKRLAEPSIRQ